MIILVPKLEVEGSVEMTLVGDKDENGSEELYRTRMDGSLSRRGLPGDTA